MLNSDETKILDILERVHDKNFVTIEELKDSFKNADDDIIEELFKNGYLKNYLVSLTSNGRYYMEKLQNLAERML